jgi:hypothetical protein
MYNLPRETPAENFKKSRTKRKVQYDRSKKANKTATRMFKKEFRGK